MDIFKSNVGFLAPVKLVVLLLLILVQGCGESASSSLSNNNNADVETPGNGDDSNLLPRLSISQLQYDGAFILSSEKFGSSTLDSSPGTFHYNPESHSVFVVSADQQHHIAEFPVPGIVNTYNMTELKKHNNLASQNFQNFWNRVPTGNVNSLNRITGLYQYDGMLIADVAKFYDGTGGNTDTTFVVRDINDLASSEVGGFFKMTGRHHSAGWISEIPDEWKGVFGASHLSGFASNYPINLRNSIGPTLFLIDLEQLKLASDGDSIVTTPLLDFSLDHPLHEDRFNDSLENNLWTDLSQASYGFIVPGTRSYLVLGSSGGHETGIGYKITQDNGVLCGGPCAYSASDYYNYYWIWDVNELLAVKNGTKQPYEILPYDYGKLEFPIRSKTSRPEIGGASFDSTTNSLYISLKGAGQLNNYDKSPAFLKFTINVD